MRVEKGVLEFTDYQEESKESERFVKKLKHKVGKAGFIDGPAVIHVFRRVLEAVQHTPLVDLRDALDEILPGLLEGRPDVADAGVVDHNVEGADQSCGPLDRTRDALLGRHVDRHEMGADFITVGVVKVMGLSVQELLAQ